MPIEYISLTNLGKLSGRSQNYLTRLIKDGRLPEGRKQWRTRLLPKTEALLALSKINRRNVGLNLPTTDDTIDPLAGLL